MVPTSVAKYKDAGELQAWAKSTMFQSWRFKLREAEEALKAGRLDEVRERLSRDDLTQFLPGKRLASKLAAQLMQRARQHARGGDLEAAWSQWETAQELAGTTDSVLTVRQDLTDASVRHVEESLNGGDVAGATRWIDQLDRRGVAKPALETLRQVTKRMQAAANLCRRGKFADAEANLAAAKVMKPDLRVLGDQHQACREKLARSRQLTERLHRALGDAEWSEAVAVSEQMLELAPECRLARDARRRAWAEVGAKFVDSQQLGATQHWTREKAVATEAVVGVNGPRFVLWVDGVGGYLVCLADEVVLGQSAPGNFVDVPVQGDLSRRHARIRREGEGYYIEPLHAASVNGHSVQTKTLLSDGDQIEFSGGVRLSFRRPHVLSASARLDFLSHHRTDPSADGVLLMAESCVLGPKWQNHVVCRDWAGDVVLYRQDEDLFCRAMESIEIDGQLCDGRGRLGGNSHVVGTDFSLSVEELDRCSTQPLL